MIDVEVGAANRLAKRGREAAAQVQLVHARRAVVQPRLGVRLVVDGDAGVLIDDGVEEVLLGGVVLGVAGEGHRIHRGRVVAGFGHAACGRVGPRVEHALGQVLLGEHGQHVGLLDVVGGDEGAARDGVPFDARVLQRGAVERARGPAPLHGDRLGVQRGERVRNLDAGHADRLSVDGRIVDAAPGRQLLDERGNLHAVLEHADLRQLGLIHRAARERHAEGDDLLRAGRDVGQRNELHIDAARRLGRGEELGREQVTSFQLLDRKLRGWLNRRAFC